MSWAVTNLARSPALSVKEIRRRQPSHFTVLVRHQGMNALENVVDTVSELDAAKAVHTALLDTEPHREQLNVSAIESWRTSARRDASTRTVAHVRGSDRHVALDDFRSVAAA